MIFIHGGSWRSGKRSDYLPYLIDYAEKGYVTATVSYRLVDEAPFPAAVQDVNCAVKWLKAHGMEYGIDSDKIVLVGGSAGGHLAMMIGYGGDTPLFNTDCEINGDSSVSAVIELYGPVDLTTPQARNADLVRDFLNVSYEENPEIYSLASPRTYISGDSPPTLIFQGTIDSVVPVSQSDSLDQWLTEAGVPHEYHRLEGWPHIMELAQPVYSYVTYHIDAFLKKYL